MIERTQEDHEDDVVAKNKPRQRINGWLVVVVLLLVVGFGGATWAAMTGRVKLVVSTNEAKTSEATSKSAPDTTTTTTTTTLVTDEGVVWLKTPEKLSAQHLFKNLSDYFHVLADEKANPEDNISYFKVGTDNGKSIIYANVPAVEVGSDIIVAFIARDATHFSMLANYTTAISGGTNSYYGPDLADGVLTDTTQTYTSITRQNTLTANNLSFKLGNPVIMLSPELFGTSIDKLLGSKYADTAYGPLYRRNNSNLRGLPIVLDVLYLQRPDSTLAAYQLYPAFMGDDNVPKVTWTNGTVNSETYRNDGGGGCGSVSSLAIPDKDIANDVQPVGKVSATDEVIYGFKSSSHDIVKAYYDEYATDNEKSVNGTTVYRDDAVSLEDFNGKYHAVFAYKDALDRYIIFSNMKYGPQAECGKPVVYLYPTTTTNVSVTVGANVTKSEPTYGLGWNVTAHPSGVLTANGKQYDSLFWEGLGKGTYPAITNGTIVKQSDLHTTLVSQMTKLGLNEKERSDFLAFWEPKMPSTPYVRLTWFGTRQMDELVPLTVTPKPDTIIRVFLDFEGLTKPSTLPSQTLSAIPRTGFTIIEWGGLLRDQQ